MFGTMLASDPPILYWLPGSVAVIRECESMRSEGIGVWETADAGPQVKMLCLDSDAGKVSGRIRSLGVAETITVSTVGGDPAVRTEGEVNG